MKLFVIGGTGYIGSVVCERLLADGHTLRGLARSDESAAQLIEAGIEPVRGSMGDGEIIGAEAANADGVVQIATGGFLSQALETVSETAVTSDAILSALAGTGKPYLVTGGTGAWMDTGLVNPERVVTEVDPMTPPFFYVHLAEITKRILSTEDVRTILICPGQLYGRRGGYIGPIARMFNGLRKHGVVYAVDYDNAVTFVHVDDLADLYALALQNPSARGIYFAATDTVPVLQVAKAVSAAAGLGGELEMVDYLTMRALNGRFNELDFFGNVRASSAKAQNELGWQPHRPGVIEDLAGLPKPLDLNSVYPEPKRQAAAARVPF
ncbi:NAD-dependent epimerase/dehydratase family protein [Mycobacteriaceae bacterium NPDC060252]